ncbi:MAG: peptide chain release factor 1 [Candidatus Andersenbacteria bacterium]|nr:peptide chain release factor 1 [Candidatus Andersenbacteria bacterium]
MNNKLEKIKKEYEETTKELNKAGVVSDVKKFKNLNKKQSKLKEIIDKYEQFLIIEKTIKENNEMIKKEDDKELILMATEENEKLTEKKERLEKEIQLLIIPKDPKDEKDVLVEIRAGAGGDEAGLFASELFRMYAKFAENNNWKTIILNSSRTPIGGFKEVIFEINGQDVYSKMKYESGVHRVQRVPETEKQGRVHTSTATVAVLPQAEETDIKIKNEDIRIDIFRSSGPGGQSVNTTDSAVRITHLSTGVTVSCQDEKSQLKNKNKAMQILRSRLLAIKEERKAKEESGARKSQIGTGDRSEKIRTYNFPQDRITDHRIKKSWHEIESILEGNIDDIISSMQQADQEKRQENE